MNGERSKRTSCVSAAHAGRPSRPKAWQQLWLDRHRETMVRRLQSHVLEMVDHLVRTGDIDPTMDQVYQTIASPYTVRVEKVRLLLDLVRKRSPETFEHFQAALRENSCADLAANDDDVQSLEAELDTLPAFERLSLDMGIPSCVLEARKLLQRLYLEAASEVHMLADIFRSRDDSSRHLDNVFVNNGLVSSDEVGRLCSSWTGKDGGVEKLLSQAMKARQITLGDLLQTQHSRGKEAARVMVLGTAGSGKSFTFLVKAVHDWCGGKLWENTCIALVRTIRCRDKMVWRAKTVSELFHLGDFGLGADEEVEVMAFISHYPELVVLVCDGLDEGEVDEGSLLWRVLSGTSLRGLRVIITSRPCHAACTLSERGAMNRHVQLFGFSKESVREFVIKYLGERQGAEMLSQLAEQPLTSTLTHTPFFALLVCEQFKEAGHIPQTRSGIFGSVTLRLLQSCARRRGLKAKFKSVEKAPDELRKHVMEVGKVAFDRLKQKDLSYFKLEDEDLSSEAVSLGFLEHVQATSQSEEDQYGFRHLTMQEFLAALYACSKVLKTAADVMALAGEFGCGKEAGHLNTFWVFVAGLLETSLWEELLCAIARTDTEAVARSMHGSECMSAPGSNLSAMVEHGRESGRIQCGDAKQRDLQLSHPHTQVEPLEVYRFLLLLHCFDEAVVDNCHKPSECVKHILQRQGVCCHGYDHLTASDLGVICRAIAYHQDILERVDMSMCQIGDDGLKQLLPGLLSCKHLKELNLGGKSSYQGSNRLSEKHMADVGEALANNRQTLETVDLGWNEGVGDEGLCRLAKAMHRLKNLKRLQLGKLGLTKASGATLASVVSHQPFLVEFNVSHNCIEDEGFVALAPALHKCMLVEVLDLATIGLTGESKTMACLSSLLSGLSQLSYLSLSFNRIQNNGFTHLAHGLQQCSYLRVLQLNYCGLTGEGPTIAMLTLVLLCLPHLKEFHTCGNKIGEAGLDQLSIGLEACPRLTHLYLRNIGLTSPQSMSTVSRLLLRLTRLVELYLHVNECGGSSSDAELCAAVKGHSSLERIWLPDGMIRYVVDQMKSFEGDPAHALEKVFFRYCRRY